MARSRCGLSGSTSAAVLCACLFVACGALGFTAASQAPVGAAQEAGASSSQAQAAVRSLLEDQVDAWNRGDLEGFLEGYWRDSRLRFASGGSVQQGFDATLERYRRRYPDRAAMGRLAFEEIDVRVLGEDWALAFGRWRLFRENDSPSGLFTLVLQRRVEGWRIVHDHTSSASP